MQKIRTNFKILDNPLFTNKQFYLNPAFKILLPHLILVEASFHILFPVCVWRTLALDSAPRLKVHRPVPSQNPSSVPTSWGSASTASSVPTRHTWENQDVSRFLVDETTCRPSANQKDGPWAPTGTDIYLINLVNILTTHIVICQTLQHFNINSFHPYNNTEADTFVMLIYRWGKPRQEAVTQLLSSGTGTQTQPAGSRVPLLRKSLWGVNSNDVKSIQSYFPLDPRMWGPRNQP